MENNIEEDIKIIEDFILKTDVDYSEYNEQIVGDISYQAIQHLLSAYQEVLKENEELKQEKINNYKMIALAQNEALGYMQGYEDGKKLRRSAVANIIENQQYYIIKKQMEKYEEHIKRLQKENEELKDTNCLVKRYFKLKDTNTYLQKENDELRKIKEISSNITEEDIDRAIKEAEKQYIPVQKVKDLIEEIQIEYNKLDKEVDEYINDVNKDLSKYYENKEKIGTMQTLSWCTDNLQELLKKED